MIGQEAPAAVHDQTAPIRADDTEATIGTFIDYKRVVLTVTSDLRRLKGYAKQLELNKTADLIDEVLERIEGDSFTVAVVGEFKRGKSTFINALLGVSVLPTDVVPCSATLNRVSYGLAPRVSLDFKDGRRVEVPFDKLEAYVTQLTEESKEIASTIKEAIVYYPSPYCQNNVDVYDTPGLNDNLAMTDVTLSILPRIDAAIMVILAQSPFSDGERDFLENRLLAADLGRVIFVVNGIDNFNQPSDADRVLKTIEDRIQRHVIERAKRQFGAESPAYETYVKKIGRPRVFGLSAYQAVQAKENNDLELLEKSRFRVFERELQKFLTERRGAITLQVPVNRAISTCREVLDTLALRSAALSLEHDQFEEAFNKSNEEIDSLRLRKTEELTNVREAGENTLKQLGPQVVALCEALRTTAERTIDQAEIKPTEVDESGPLIERLGKLVDNAIRRESETQAMAIQGHISDALIAEAERLAGFSELMASLMDRVNINFGGVKTEYHFGGHDSGFATALAVLSGWGGAWSGYREAGAKGAVVGAAATVGTVVVGVILLSVMAIPIGIPAAIGLSLASLLPGSMTARWVFPGVRVERFRASYKEAVLKELDESLYKADLKHQVEEQVRSAFECLRERLGKEADAVLTDAEAALLSLRTRYERHSALSDAEAQELQEIEQATRAIGDNAARLSKQLVEVMDI